jgi:guanylate kinase
MGKSSSGKDTIFKILLNDRELSLKTIIPYTTRPMRGGEQDGVEYHFCDDAKSAELEEAGRIIELRAYHTVHGIWKYFTVDDGQIDLLKNDYLYITTLAAYENLRDYYGKEAVLPIYIQVEDGERLTRALERERQQETPRYEEMCRRFLADAADFSEEKLAKAGITRRFINEELNKTAQNIKEYMLE